MGICGNSMILSDQVDIEFLILIKILLCLGNSYLKIISRELTALAGVRAMLVCKKFL